MLRVSKTGEHNAFYGESYQSAAFNKAAVVSRLDERCTEDVCGTPNDDLRKNESLSPCWIPN
jgi:hypothetical protein